MSARPPISHTPSAGRRPVILLGGHANALSIVRSLSRRGIKVTVVAEANSVALRSRHCHARYPRPEGREPREYWRDLLLRERVDEWRGSVLFPCEDNAIATVAAHYEALAQEYLLDDYDPALWSAMLDKSRTLELAREAGCDVPRTLEILDEDGLRVAAETFEFPVLLKPRHSHLFKAHFGRKLFVVNSADELLVQGKAPLELGLKMMAAEYIPGPDTLLSSYYTHLSAGGEHLFHFTKRVIRRSPPRVGTGCYHMTEWLPETAEEGRKFFRHIGFRGFANIEFKRDPRDGRLKVIECNARFTEAHELITRSGLDLALLLYEHLTGENVEPVPSARDFVSLWYPEADFDSFRRLRREGSLTLTEWFRSIARPQHFPYFRVTDPLPAATLIGRSLRSRVLGRPFRVVERAFRALGRGVRVPGRPDPVAESEKSTD